MRRLLPFCLTMLLFGSAGFLFGQNVPPPDQREKKAKAASTTTPPVAEAVALAPTPALAGAATTVHWYGHAFIYLTNSTGVRIAFDPFGSNMVKYKFPEHLAADIVLVSCLSDDHEAADLLFGNPPVFRVSTGVGPIRANGLDLKGVESYRDPDHQSPNTVYVAKLDGVNFVHLGSIGALLDFRERQQIGNADVLFLPIGNPRISLSDLNRMVTDLHAKIIVPIYYKTPLTGELSLRTLDEYLSGQTMEVKKFDKPEFQVNGSALPEKPTIYLLPSPSS